MNPSKSLLFPAPWTLNPGIKIDTGENSASLLRPFGPLIGIITPFPIMLYLFSTFPPRFLSCAVSHSLICQPRSSANFVALPSSPSPPPLRHFKLNLWYSRHLLRDYSGSLSPVWLLPLPFRPPSPYPSSPRLLPQLPWSGWLAPLLKGVGTWVYEGSLWESIQPYHHREAVLWRAKGCFWTSRFMEITDQSSDWQATDCMSLSESWLMGADGWVGALQDACVLTAWCQV